MYDVKTKFGKKSTGSEVHYVKKVIIDVQYATKKLIVVCDKSTDCCM